MRPNSNTLKGVVMSKRHHFIESDAKYQFHRVIFCTACGMVVWHFNYPDTSREELQKKVGKPCIDAHPTHTEGGE